MTYAVFTEHMDAEQHSAFDLMLAGDVGGVAARQTVRTPEQRASEGALMAAFMLPQGDRR